MEATVTMRRGIVKEESIRRFDVQQRIQHLLMMSTFTILALTGLPLKFHDSGLSQWWVAVWGGIENTRNIHHIAAWVMGFDMVYHIGYIVFSTVVLKRPFPIWMIPNIRDVFDFMRELRYFLGLSRERPQFGRFSYHEKFDYWAVFWGIPVMGISGLIMMYPVLATKFLPGWVLPAALVAHSDEAILAIGWIFIVHVFYVHLAPHIFPFNTSIFTGRVPKSRYATDHPLEYGELVAAKGEHAGEPVPKERQEEG